VTIQQFTVDCVTWHNNWHESIQGGPKLNRTFINGQWNSSRGNFWKVQGSKHAVMALVYLLNILCKLFRTYYCYEGSFPAVQRTWVCTASMPVCTVHYPSPHCHDPSPLVAVRTIVDSTAVSASHLPAFPDLTDMFTAFWVGYIEFAVLQKQARSPTIRDLTGTTTWPRSNLCNYL